MVAVTFITTDGTEMNVDARPGLSLMEAARAADVPGIVAECGGSCSCSTCHVYVAPEWVGKLKHADDMETDLLDFAWEPNAETSRLSCQITVTDDLNGMRVTVPAQQG